MTLTFEELQRSQARDSMRELMVVTAGTRGDALKLWRQFERMAGPDGSDRSDGSDIECGTPRSQAEFEAMLKASE